MIATDNSPTRFGTLPRLAEGGTVVCLAPGPSLTKADADYVRGKATVIAINDAVDVAPWADVAWGSDSAWWIKRDGLQKFQGLCATVAFRPNGPQFKHLILLRMLAVEGISFRPIGIATAKNSGGGAINVAVLLGAKRIILVGYDLGPEGKRYHFSDPQWGGPKTKSNYDAFRQYITTMASPLQKAGIDVVNCSRRTRLDCFRRAPLEATI